MTNTMDSQINQDKKLVAIGQILNKFKDAIIHFSKNLGNGKNRENKLIQRVIKKKMHRQQLIFSKLLLEIIKELTINK